MREIIFLVEAEIGACQLAQRSLEETGFEVRTFSTTAVIEAALENQPVLLLIADALPDGSGLDLCARIRQNPWLAKTPIVLLNSNASEEGRDAGHHAGAGTFGFTRRSAIRDSRD